MAGQTSFFHGKFTALIHGHVPLNCQAKYKVTKCQTAELKFLLPEKC